MTERPQYDEPMPQRMRHLQRDPRGFVIPYFVAWLDDQQREVDPPNGTPDFRILSPGRMARCKRLNLCWLCGQPLGSRKVFAIGPMCAATRTTLEPPGHYECCIYSVKVCPFLSRPRMVRNEKDMPEGHWAPGLTITRNPGVTALWVTRTYKTFDSAEAGLGRGELIRVGDPERVEWWAQGRAATREEVKASIDSGLPILRATADRQDAQWPPIAPDDPRGARYALEHQNIPSLDALLPV